MKRKKLLRLGITTLLVLLTSILVDFLVPLFAQTVTAAGISSEDKSIYSNVTYDRIGALDAKSASIAISVANPYVNIREQSNTDGKVLGKLYKGSAAAIISKKGDWVLIESGNVKGYIKSEFLNMELSKEEITQKYGSLRIVVNTDGLNVREKSDKESKKLAVIYANEVYSALKVTDEWVQITVDEDNVTGYVAREYVELIVNYKQAISIKEEQALLRLQEEDNKKASSKNTDSNKVAIAVQSNKSYSEKDLKLLACLIHAESGNQSYEGKLAVANVVLNRVNSSAYPDTLKDVIYQSGQFSVASSGSLEKQLDNYSNYTSVSQKLSIDAARTALEGSNNIGDCLHFNRYTASREKSNANSVRIEGQLFW